MYTNGIKINTRAQLYTHRLYYFVVVFLCLVSGRYHSYKVFFHPWQILIWLTLKNLTFAQRIVDIF